MDDPLYYLRTIHRRLLELRRFTAPGQGPTLPSEALNDEIDWLDCYIDRLSRSGK